MLYTRCQKTIGLLQVSRTASGVKVVGFHVECAGYVDFTVQLSIWMNRQMSHEKKTLDVLSVSVSMIPAVRDSAGPSLSSGLQVPAGGSTHVSRRDY